MASGFTFIYGLKDPNTNLIRYIGKANDAYRRYKAHINSYFLKGNTHKENWINKLKRNNQLPILEILAIVPRANWRVHEIKWIRKFNNLTNASDGGEGLCSMSQEVKDKISLAKKGCKGNRLGMKNTPEHIEAVRQAKLGSKHTKESIDKMCKNLYKIITPQGNEIITNNLTRFAEENNLSAAHLHKVVKGNRKQHKGYKAFKIERSG